MVSDMASDSGPWPFQGEALVVWGHDGPRPLLLAALHRVGVPAGPVVEIAVAHLVAGRGHVPTLTRVPLAVAAAAPELADPAAEPATLKWFTEGRRREVNWEERGIRLRAEVGRNDVPGSIPARLLASGALAAAGRIPGRLAGAHIDVDVPAGDPLAFLAGRRLGFLFSTTRAAGEPLRLRLGRRPQAPVAEPA